MLKHVFAKTCFGMQQILWMENLHLVLAYIANTTMRWISTLTFGTPRGTHPETSTHTAYVRRPARGAHLRWVETATLTNVAVLTSGTDSARNSEHF